MISYADLRWKIINKWNSDAKYTNDKLISIASEMGVDIDSTDRKAIIAKVVDGVIGAGIDSGEYTVDSWGNDSENDTNFKNYMGNLEILESTLDIDEDADPDLHEHEDGTVHSHPHNEEPTHDEDLPDFKKMSKKTLDDWALEKGIKLDRRKTKAHMLKELKSKLN